MTTAQTALLLLCAALFAGMGLAVHALNRRGLNIKSRQVGDGQHGTARWATRHEIRRTFTRVPFTPNIWRNSPSPPRGDSGAAGHGPQGIVIGCKGGKKHVTALVDTGDVHALMIGAAGVGKTAYFMVPNIEYALASGMSFLVSDTKGDIVRWYAGIASEQYGYNVSVLDLRNPSRSDGYNMLHMVNRYMDIYLSSGDLAAKAGAERYAKITAKTLAFGGGDTASLGQNVYFYEAAEGLLTAVILLVAEFAVPSRRHIVSVFKLIQELMLPSEVKGVSRFQKLMASLPETHKARWFAGAALSGSEQAMASVLSTAMSRLNAFLDSELERVLCFNGNIDAETFCRKKSAVFLVLPEENPTTFFFVSLIVQQFYRELLSVADENGGKLPNRVLFLLDDFGTISKIDAAEMMFSASRSRRISIVAIIQSLAQLEKSYGKEGAQILWDNCQLTIFGGFAPNSETAKTLSKNLGEQTIQSGYVTKGKGEGSTSLQMMGRALMTADELKAMSKGQFVVLKTGCYPMKSRLRLFSEWGITFGEDYVLPERAARVVEYADRLEIEAAIRRKYPHIRLPAAMTGDAAPPAERRRGAAGPKLKT